MEMTSLKLSLFQMNYGQGEVEENFARVRDAAGRARELGTDIMLLPELWYSGYDLRAAASIAARPDHDQFEMTAALARENGIYLAGSMLCRREDGGVANRAVLYGPDGSLVGYYDKIHLFPKLHEHDYLVPGDRLPVFDLPWGRTAMAICYDLRFPEIFRRYVLHGGVRLILVPSAWPEPRLRFLRLMALARASENQCYLAVCNRSGYSSAGRPMFGNSVVADPWGDAVAEAGRDEELVTIELEPALVDRARSSLNLKRDLRWDLFYPGKDPSP